MNDLLLILGDDIKINTPFLNYIFKSYILKFGELGDIKFIDKNDKNIIENIINLSKIYKYITIFSSDENYHLIAKILASLNDDLLEIKFEDTLTPSLAINSKEGSFLVSLNDCDINLVKANPLNKLSEFLIRKNNLDLKFYIYGFKFEDVEAVFKEFETKFNTEISITRYSKFVIFAKAISKKFSDLNGLRDELLNTFINRVIFEENLAMFIVSRLKNAKLKLSFAESCSCGLMASKIGEISGASQVFDGSLVTYSNEIKHLWLDVNNETLNEFGAVSKECVNEMLKGVLKTTGADFSMAISGIAGPNGGSEDKPVGTVIIGASSTEKQIVEKFFIKGDRNYIRNESVNIAFSLLLEVGSEIFLN